MLNVGHLDYIVPKLFIDRITLNEWRLVFVIHKLHVIEDYVEVDEHVVQIAKDEENRNEPPAASIALSDAPVHPLDVRRVMRLTCTIVTF